MNKLGLIIFMSLCFFTNALKAMDTSDRWDSKLLLDTCPKQLKEAIDFIKKEYTDPKDKVIAILPEKIGYQYFAVTFKKVENGMATSTIFSFEFEYWSEAEVADGPVKCTRVEPMDFLI